eukprot:177334_1
MKLIFTLLLLLASISNSNVLNEIETQNQQLKLVYSALDVNEVRKHYDQSSAPYHTETCDSDSNIGCDHPSRKCNLYCSCNIKSDDGYIYDISMLFDYIFTITQKSFIWSTEYQYNVSFCRNNIVYDGDKCNLPASITQYETAHYPSSNPKCFNIGYWTHDATDTYIKGISNNNSFSFMLYGDTCLEHSGKERVTKYTFKCDINIQLEIENVFEDPICSYNIVFKTKFACRTFQDSIKLTPVDYICQDKGCNNNPLQQFSRQLTESLIPQNQLPRHKYSYNLVKHAINTLEPKSRDTKNSHQVLRFPMHKMDENLDDLINEVVYELGIENLHVAGYSDLQYKIKQQARFAKMGAVGLNTYKYTHVNISFDWGGTSNIMVGGIGFQKVDDDIMFGISLYKEQWTEEYYARINQNADVWDEKEIQKYAFYLLYLNLKDRLGYT